MNDLKLILSTLALLMCPFIVHADNSPPYATITVKGMVCSFCVQGVEKKLLELKVIEKVTVDLKQKTVSVWVSKDGTLTDLEMKNAIRSAGYNIESIQRRGLRPKLRQGVYKNPSLMFSH